MELFNYTMILETKQLISNNHVNRKNFCKHKNYPNRIENPKKNLESGGNFDCYLTKRSQLVCEIVVNRIENTRLEKLCYCDQSCRKLPIVLAQLYGPKVHSLDLSYNELVSLTGLEYFPNIRELILDNNQLEDGLVIPKLMELQTLSMNKNKICDLDSLLRQIKLNLPALTYLSLLGNKACPNQLSGIENDDEDYQRYRYFVLYHLPHLKFLDSKAVSPQERQEAKTRGRFMNVITPKYTEEEEVEDLDVPLSRRLLAGERIKFSPLSRALRGPNDFKGIYGKCRYRYSGKHSEGNRFISNQDL